MRVIVLNVNEIRSQLPLGGARPTLFKVQFVNPSNSAGDIKVPFLCFSSSLPASNLGLIQVPYFGRTIKLAGDRSFDPWTVALYNDEDFLVKNALESWSNSINSMQGNIRGFGTSASSAYKSDAIVQQISKTGVTLREYKFVGIFPRRLSPIQLAWNQTDAIETFECDFEYDWWEVSGGITGNIGSI